MNYKDMVLTYEVEKYINTFEFRYAKNYKDKLVFDYESTQKKYIDFILWMEALEFEESEVIKRIIKLGDLEFAEEEIE